MTTLQTLGQQSLFALEMMAVLSCALSGVLGALRKRMDLVGICVCGFLVAFGGGVLRDILIDRRPFFSGARASKAASGGCASRMRSGLACSAPRASTCPGRPASRPWSPSSWA